MLTSKHVNANSIVRFLVIKAEFYSVNNSNFGLLVLDK
jgi:hypothetical protein